MKRLLSNPGLQSAAIQAAGRGFALLLSIVLARSLGAQGYGVYAYSLALMNVALIVGEFGVPNLVMREVAAASESKRYGLLRGALRRGNQMVVTLSVLVSSIGFVILWLMREALTGEVLYTTALMLLLLPLTSLARTLARALRGLQQLAASQVLEMLLPHLLVLMFVGAIFYWAPNFREPYTAMGAQVVAGLLVLGIALWLMRRMLAFVPLTAMPEYLDTQWRRSLLPFALIGSAGILNNQTDMIMLAWFRSSEVAGVYRVAVQGATLVAFGIQVANTLIAPQFARLAANGDTQGLQAKAQRSSQITVLAALPLTLLFIFLGEDLVVWVFGESFRSAYLPLAILSAGQLLNAFFGSCGVLLSMAGHERDTARALMISAALNIGLNALLIPAYGMVGAAVASVLCLAFWNILLHITVRRRLQVNTLAIQFTRGQQTENPS